MFSNILYPKPIKKTSHYNRYLGFSELSHLSEEELYLIHLGIDKCFQKDRYAERNLTHHFRLNHAILKLRLGKKVAATIKSLIEKNIWCKITNYSNGHFSTTYAFNMSVLGYTRCMVGIGKYLDLEKKHDTRANRKYADQSGVCACYLKTLKAAQLTMSDEEIVAAIYKEYPDEDNEDRKWPILKMCQKIQNGHLKISNENKVNRHYGTLSHIPKYIRKRVTINGHPITEIDIKSSHPFLLVAAVKLLNNKEPITKYNISGEKLIKSNDTNNLLCDKWDFAELEHDILVGDVYKKLGNALTNKTPRSKIKIAMLAWLYGKKSSDIQIHKAIKQVYPSLWQFRNELRKRKQLKELSRVIQRIESAILTEISQRLIKWSSSILLYPLHDALLSIPKYKERIRHVMQTVFIELFGISPQVTIKIAGETV